MSYQRYSRTNPPSHLMDDYVETDYDEEVEMDMSGFLNNPPPHIQDSIVEEAYDEAPPVTPRPRQRPRTDMGYTIRNPLHVEPDNIDAPLYYHFSPFYAHDASLRGNPKVMAGIKTTGAALALGGMLYNLGNTGSGGLKVEGVRKMKWLGTGMYLHSAIGWNHGLLQNVGGSGIGGIIARYGAKAISHGAGLYVFHWALTSDYMKQNSRT